VITFDVSWFAIVAAAIVATIIGMAWYSKSLFGTSWAKEMGFSDADMKKMAKDGMGKMMTINFIFTLVMAFVLANFLGTAGASTMGAGATFAFWLWLGFILPLQVGGMLWEGKSQKLLTINASYWLVNLVVMSAVLNLLG